MVLSLVLTLFITGSSHGKLLKSEKQIINEGIKSTLLIRTYKKGKLIETGAGFFVSNEGHLITNKHVLATFLNDPQKHQLSIETSSGKLFSRATVLKCGDDRNIDLCLARIEDSNVRYFFKISNKKSGMGESVIKIGHCKTPPFDVDYAKLGNDYVKNIVSKKGGKQVWNKNVSMIETNVPQCSGDSGGPQFSSNTGFLIGVTTVTHTESRTRKKYMMSIAAFEVNAYLNEFKSSVGRSYRLKKQRSSTMEAFPTTDKERLELMNQL